MVNPSFNFFPIDSFLSQYKMMLGEFETDLYDDLLPAHKVICYILFFLSTFMA